MAQAITRKGMQAPASEEEKAWRQETMQTRGRKGCQCKRINMSFTESNYKFLTEASRAQGITITKFCNRIIKIYQHEHPELMEKIEEMRKAAGYYDNEE